MGTNEFVSMGITYGNAYFLYNQVRLKLEEEAQQNQGIICLMNKFLSLFSFEKATIVSRASLSIFFVLVLICFFFF